MPRFRVPASPSGPITPEGLRRLIAEMIRPGHFFVGPDLDLIWDHRAAEEVVWEIFQGRLLDPAHTRQRRSFEAWDVSQAGAAEPLVSLKLDAEARQLHVVRGLDSYVWEGYDAGGNVYQSREVRKWVRELLGTMHLDHFADLDELRDELACRLFLAVVGTSRLPLSSVESPLPAFSFGQLFYSYRPDAPGTCRPVRDWRGLVREMLGPWLGEREQARLGETFLRAVPPDQMGEAAGAFVGRWSELGRTAGELSNSLRRLFNEVSLSPYTDLVEKALAFLHRLEECRFFTTAQVVDFRSYLLRHLGRHLTAYDLVVFHHRGANYPDALMLDAVLKDYLALIERRPELFAEAADDDADARRRKRLRRRALRQAWLLRRRYEGHAVPDLPTSPGENARVLPPSHPRVAEEQIVQPARRKRRLYDGDLLTLPVDGPVDQVLRESLQDLAHPEEWRELGLAVFLDRPLGIGKAATEPDGTLLLSAEAFSASIARARLRALDLPVPANLLEIHGLPLDAIGGTARPGTVSLTDARRAAADFVFLRTTPGTARAFRAQFDFTPLVGRFHLEDVLGGRDILIAHSATGAGLVMHDVRLRPRVEMEVVTEAGYEGRAGLEYPVGGLRVLRVWETTAGGESLQAHDLRGESLYLLLRR